MKNNIPHIVIVGGGAGGLELAAHLGKKLGRTQKALITLINPSPIHLWKPLLHEVAAGTLNSYEDELNYLAYASQHYFQFCLGTMIGIDREKKIIKLASILDQDNQELIPERVLNFDIAIIAVGSISNDFNVPGVREHCLFIDNVEEANQFQKLLIKTMMNLPYQKKPLHIVVVGGGATGVELTAELHYALRQMASYGFDFDPEQVTFTIIEANAKLLPAVSSHLSDVVYKQLQQLKVTILTNEQVVAVTTDGFKTHSGKFIPATLKIWAAGIKAPDFLKELDGLEINKINQLLVKPTLQTTRDPFIFAMGDCASCIQSNGNPIPPRAQAAHQEATFLAHILRKYLHQILASESFSLPIFQYRDYGSLISLSHYETVGNLMGRITKSLMIEGKLARMAYLSLYKMHQIALYGPWRISALMFANLLTRKIRPRLKLH